MSKKAILSMASIFMIATMTSVFSCKPKQDERQFGAGYGPGRPSADAVKRTEAPQTSSGVSPASSDGPVGDHPSTKGKSMKECHAKGLAWIAVKDGGPPACGKKRVKWCCHAKEIQARFPVLFNPKIKPAMDKNVNNGYKLYDCSEAAATETAVRLHFADFSAGEYLYRYIDINTHETKSEAVVDPCPTVTEDDLLK